MGHSTGPAAVEQMIVTVWHDPGSPAVRLQQGDSWALLIARAVRVGSQRGGGRAHQDRQAGSVLAEARLGQSQGTGQACEARLICHHVRQATTGD